MSRFCFDTLEQLAEQINASGYAVPLSENDTVLAQPMRIFDREAPNRLVVQPMEGRDALPDGAPGELTRRRYLRFARGGAGMIWFEAVAVSAAARADERQLWLNERSADAYAALTSEIRLAAKEAGFPEPLLVLQLSHSGRYAAQPLTVRRCALTERPGVEYRIASDDELDAIHADFATTAKLARQAGFDAVDIKCCHGYLFAELLSAFDRLGKYGGALENRARLLLDSVRASVLEGIPTAVRLSAFDAVEGGFGYDAAHPDKPDYSEMKTLIKMLVNEGVGLINITAGNPYFNPHVNRPYDCGAPAFDEPQLCSVSRLLAGAREAKSVCPPQVPVVASGFSWLREFGMNAAAGGIEAGWFDLAGFGRQAIAYPEFALDILKNGALMRKKCCVACSGCSRRMRSAMPSGCIVHDRALFPPVR